MHVVSLVSGFPMSSFPSYAASFCCISSAFLLKTTISHNVILYPYPRFLLLRRRHNMIQHRRFPTAFSELIIYFAIPASKNRERVGLGGLSPPESRDNDLSSPFFATRPAPCLHSLPTRIYLYTFASLASTIQKRHLPWLSSPQYVYSTLPRQSFTV